MLHHLQGQLTVVLVDSAVNSGKTVVQFVQHICNLNTTICIVVVAGVAQAQSVRGQFQITRTFSLFINNSSQVLWVTAYPYQFTLPLRLLIERDLRQCVLAAIVARVL
jgi:uracil phosphoribosyltransferase